MAVLAPAHSAKACSPDPCADAPAFDTFVVGHDSVATDGVLVFEVSQGSFGAFTTKQVLAAIDLRVTDAQDQPVEGALEYTDGLYIWRPAAALPAGGDLSIAVDIDNAALSSKLRCGSDEFAPLTVSVTEGTVPALALPTVAFDTQHSISQDLSLDGLVCCDGAFPEIQYTCDEELLWNEGHCEPTSGTGYASASFSADDLDPLLAAAVRAELLVDAQVIRAVHGTKLSSMSVARTEAFQATLRLVSLLDGSEVSSEAFTADGGQPDQLGPLELDPAPGLERVCEGQPYTCSRGETGDAWDPDLCDPWDDGGDSDTDGDIDTDSDSDGSDSDGPDSDGPDSDGPDTGDSDTDGPDSGSGSSGGEQDGGGGGCSVGAGTGGSGWMWMLLGVAAPLLRRRR